MSPVPAVLLPQLPVPHLWGAASGPPLRATSPSSALLCRASPCLRCPCIPPASLGAGWGRGVSCLTAPGSTPCCPLEPSLLPLLLHASALAASLVYLQSLHLLCHFFFSIPKSLRGLPRSQGVWVAFVIGVWGCGGAELPIFGSDPSHLQKTGLALPCGPRG